MTEIWIIVAMLIGIVIGRLWDIQGKPRERKGNRARERPSEDEERQAERIAAEAPEEQNADMQARTALYETDQIV